MTFGFKITGMSMELLLKHDSLAIVRRSSTLSKQGAFSLLFIDGYIIIRKIRIEAGKYYTKVVNTHLGEPIQKFKAGSYQVVGEVIGELSCF